MSDPVATFEEHRPAGISVPSRAALGTILGSFTAAAAEPWSTFEVPPHEFAVYIAARLPDAGELAAVLEGLVGHDLYLACGCARGDDAAIAALEAKYGGVIEAAARRVQHGHLTADDFGQILRRKLYVGTPGAPPAISRYSGRGYLGVWLRVTAMRAALNASRDSKDVDEELPSNRETSELDAKLRDPELQFLKQTYRKAFKEAFAVAVKSLEGRQRTVLRQSVIHGLTVREIGKIFGVHHGTAAKWVNRARQALVHSTRGSLAAALRVDDRELESIMALIESRLDVSVARVLSDDE